MIAPTQGQPGSLDATFGNGGIVTAPQTAYVELGYEVILQPDGKILLGGFQEDNNIRDFAVARYNPDGSLDNSFGSGGLAVIDGGTDSDAAWSMALQDDGKIILAGSVYHQFTTFDDFAMVRLNADGSPDNTFGNAGFVSTDIDQGWDLANAIVIQPDGKILLGGMGYTSNLRKFCVVRYNTDGTLDPSFGSGGIALAFMGCGNERAKDMALQPDGKIIVCGYLNEGIDDHTLVMRMNTDGTIDNTFGNNGWATLDIGANDDVFLTVRILDNNKILTAGYSRDATNNRNYLIVRYLSDGTLDNSFGGGSGIKMHNVGLNDIVFDIAVQEDGKILTAGGAFSFEMLRMLEDGNLDFSFGNNGVVNTSIGTSSSSQSLCMQNDGKVILAGYSKEGSGEFDLALARYHLEDNGGITNQEAIFQNISAFPNPVTGNELKLRYSLQNDEKVSVELLSVNGQFVGELMKKQFKISGMHEENLNLPAGLPGGVYFIRLQANSGFTVIRIEQL